MVRFDKPCSRKVDALKYFESHMAKRDYLTESGKIEMVWYGEGAAKLGLSGQVYEDHFARLCSGHDPFTDEKLMLRDAGDKRRVCFFGQISAPKDVSIAYLVGGDSRIAGWWQESVTETLKELEDVTATRVRTGGAMHDRPTGSMVAAVVTHDTSRSLDPQLHTHVCIMNLTYDSVEERWKAVQPNGYYKYQGYLREVSYNKLAEKMKDGGYEIEKARFIGFHIKGFPSDLRERFSKRREEIERTADALKAHSQDAIQTIAGKTRTEKTETELEELKTRWTGDASEHLPHIRQVIAQARSVNERERTAPHEAMSWAMAHVFDRLSVANERILLREALIAGRGDVTLDQLKEDMASRVGSEDLLRKGEMLTTPEMVQLEKALVEWGRNGKNICPVMGNYTPGKFLSAEQNDAAQTLLASRDRVVVLIGDAGAGKSTTLPVIIRGIHEAGSLTFACAPSAGAVHELQDKLGIEANTVQQLLVNGSLQEQMAGRTIIVDEAGLLSVRQMNGLFEIAERQNCRLLLVGDTKQHHSVEAGDALRAFQSYAKVETVRLQEIHRQKNEEYKQVVKYLAEGMPYSSFAKLNELGGIREERDWDKLLRQAASSYADKIATGQSCLALSPVWSEVNAFTSVVRDNLKERGLLGTEEKECQTVQSLQWTPAEKSQVSNYQPRDVLTFHRDSGEFKKHESITVVSKDEKRLVIERNDGSRSFFDPQKTKGFDVGLPRKLAVAFGEKLLVRANFAPSKLKNGDIVTAKELKKDGSIALADGRTIPAHFRQFTYGYATTSHTAQGKTVDHGILVLGDEGYQAANVKQAYVSNSRFSQTQTIFTTDKEQAFESMARFEERPLAGEIITATLPEPASLNSKEEVALKNELPLQSKQNESLDWNSIEAKYGIKQ